MSSSIDSDSDKVEDFSDSEEVNESSSDIQDFTSSEDDQLQKTNSKILSPRSEPVDNDDLDIYDSSDLSSKEEEILKKAREELNDKNKIEQGINELKTFQERCLNDFIEETHVPVDRNKICVDNTSHKGMLSIEGFTYKIDQPLFVKKFGLAHYCQQTLCNLEGDSKIFDYTHHTKDFIQKPVITVKVLPLIKKELFSNLEDVSRNFYTLPCEVTIGNDPKRISFYDIKKGQDKPVFNKGDRLLVKFILSVNNFAQSDYAKLAHIKRKKKMIQEGHIITLFRPCYYYKNIYTSPRKGYRSKLPVVVAHKFAYEINK